jgi:hypothetical protein
VKSGVFLVAFCARLKTYGALFGDKNHKAFSRFCLCGHEKSGLGESTAGKNHAVCVFTLCFFKVTAVPHQLRARPPIHSGERAQDNPESC